MLSRGNVEVCLLSRKDFAVCVFVVYSHNLKRFSIFTLMFKLFTICFTSFVAIKHSNQKCMAKKRWRENRCKLCSILSLIFVGNLRICKIGTIQINDNWASIDVRRCRKHHLRADESQYAISDSWDLNVHTAAAARVCETHERFGVESTIDFGQERVAIALVGRSKVPSLLFCCDVFRKANTTKNTTTAWIMGIDFSLFSLAVFCGSHS